MTYSATYSNGTVFSGTFLKFDATAAILYIAPSGNNYVGNYTIRYTAVITSSTSYKNFTDFIIEIVPNNPPVPKLDFLNTTTIYAHHNYSWTVLYSNDSEGDIASFSAEILDINYVSINSSANYFVVT